MIGYVFTVAESIVSCTSTELGFHVARLMSISVTQQREIETVAFF